MDRELDDRLTILGVYMGNQLTEEQKEFACDFTKNTVSFSDPGTGKTYSTIAGIVMAQTVHGVPGSKIHCMSFTNAATSEIKARYDALCKRCAMSPTATFSTFHALSRKIMNDAYPNIKIVSCLNLKEDLSEFVRIMNEEGVGCGDYNYAKRVLYTIDSLNSSLTFDEHNVRENYKFTTLNMDVDAFQKLRKRWFANRLTHRVITQGDIPLYCLYALMARPEVGEIWKGKYKILIVDEFQDLSLLHLKILAIIAETLVVIGDIKQQIYGFNGACPQIVDEYMKMFPDARVCPLSKSFRCKGAVVDFATKVVKNNNMSYTEFKPVSEGGAVSLYSQHELDLSNIIKTIQKDIEENTIYHAKNVLFLYRNNASSTPVIEELYKADIPFRCTKFKKIMDLPIFGDLCIMADVAEDPGNVEKVMRLMRLIPEYSRLPYGQDPTPVQIMKQCRCDIFSIPYDWTDEETKQIMYSVARAAKAIEAGKSASIVLNHCLMAYEKYIIHEEWWRFDMSKEFYMNLVAPLITEKTYPRMVSDEWFKQQKNEQCIKAGIGVRCYTMHASKGLEADEVYILDAEDSLFPNEKELNRMLQAGCTYEASCRIRDERNLLFVACTRAKDRLVISYSTEPTDLLVSPEENRYTWLDDIYANHINKYDDALRFAELFNLNKESV